jgi:hypothetical protein
MTTDRFSRIVAVLAAAFWLVTGLWAFLAPRSFFDEVATFPPYNRHLFHDVGAFSVGLAAVLVFALLGWSALQSVLAGTAVAAVLHAVSHVLDRDLGGRDADPISLSVIALLFLAGAVAAWPRRGRERSASPRKVAR